MIDFGIEIKNGKLCNPIKSTMMGTNILELLKNIKAISSEARNMAGTVYPYLLIENVKVSSE
jgi:predicted Zn-dependent protease